MSIDEVAGRRATLSPAKQALLARLMRGGVKSDAAERDAIRPRGERGPVPLSGAQQRLWFMHQMDPGSGAFNVPAVLRLRGALDAEVLERALAEVVRRHQSLRTIFTLQGATPVQEVVPAPSRVLQADDLSAVPPAAREAAARARVADEADAPFDLATGPVFRARLLRLAADDHVLVIIMHHIVSDAWSTGVLYRELAALYGAFTRGEPSPLPELPIQYADYAAWHRTRLAGPELTRQVEYWRARLAGSPVLLDLPTDRPRPAVQGTASAAHRFPIPRPLFDRLSELARTEGATPFMALAAAWSALLSRWSGQDDVVVGTPLAGRTQPETEPLIGFFIQTLALRMDLSGDPAFRELLGRVRQTTVEAYTHQDVPFDLLVEELKVERSVSHAPVFQAMIALQNAAGAGPEFPGLSAEPMGAELRSAQNYLMLAVHEKPREMVAMLQYPTELFDASTMQRLAGHLLTLLEGAVADPDAPVTRLPLLTDDERARLALDCAGPSAELPALPVHRLIEAQAARTPDAEAVVIDGRVLRYGEMNARANRLARRLRARGVGLDARVGTCFERGPEAVVAMLAVLKAGGAYVPLDPAMPAARRDGVLADAGVRIVLTVDGVAKGLPQGIERIRLDADAASFEGEDGAELEGEVPLDALAYVIYTSGSTGAPKGVMVPHAGILNLALAFADTHALHPGARLLALPPLTFDAFAGNLYPGLMTGTALVFHPNPVELTGRGLLAFCRRHGVTAVDAPAALLKGMMDDLAPLGEGGVDGPLREMWTGGEAVDMERVRRWERTTGGRMQLVSHYGPTEASVCATLQKAYGPDAPRGEPVNLPLGRPLANLRLYVLDARLQPQPAGVPGELFIAGAGVARGYQSRPALTAQAFLPDPFGERPGARMYRTGDRARFRPDGTLEFMGRLDFQVKVRGFRIEPGEIQAALLAHPAVREATVIVREDTPGDARLVAYLVPAEGAAAPSAAQLRDHLARSLPEYMIPAAFVPLDAMPVTPNGKTDRRALPAPTFAAERDHTPPRTPAEKAIAGFWAEALGGQRVGVEDNFFEVGGHSLLVARVHQRIREAFDREVTLVDLFRHTTVAAQAAFVTANPQSATAVTPAQSRGTDRAEARRAAVRDGRRGARR
jgi:amino acid adenylation domain-containing protein